MLRTTGVARYFKAKMFTTPAMATLRGRLKHEKKLGQTEVLRRMQMMSLYRVEVQKGYRYSITKANVNSAAREHGTDFYRLSNDLARQNTFITMRMHQRLAQYEPMAFRAVVELAASGICPPAPPVDRSKSPADPAGGEANASAELRIDLARMLRVDPEESVLPDRGDSSMSYDPVDGLGGSAAVDKWMSAAAEFEKDPLGAFASTEEQVLLRRAT